MVNKNPYNNQVHVFNTISFKTHYDSEQKINCWQSSRDDECGDRNGNLENNKTKNNMTTTIREITFWDGTELHFNDLDKIEWV